MKKLILASTSPYRKELLERLGVSFDCVPSYVDEELLKNQGLSPHDLAMQLAIQKAQVVAKQYPGCHVLGADQLVSFEGQVLGKPGSKEKAKEQLLSMSGKKHELVTAVAIAMGEEVLLTHIDRTTLWMRPLRNEQIDRYLKEDQPFDCAGSYKLEQKGIALFSKIDSEDHTAIIGLPLLKLGDLLIQLGYQVPS